MNRWETDCSRDVLERIVALLFSLAGLADRAAGLPLLRRRHVLGILSHGEAVARAFVIGISTEAATTAEAPGADAVRLAARLRALALLLIVFLAGRIARPRPAGPRADRGKPAGQVGNRSPLSVPDTS